MGGPEAAAPAYFAEFKAGSVQDGAQCRGEEQPCGYPPFTIQPGNIPPGSSHPSLRPKEVNHSHSTRSV